MNYEEEIKKLKRMDFKLFTAFSNIISILNEKEKDEFLNIQKDYIGKDINNFGKDINNYDEEIEKVIDEELDEIKFNIVLINKRHDMIYEDTEQIKKDMEWIKKDMEWIKKDVNYLMDKQKEREEKLRFQISKFFTYESSVDEESETNYIDNINDVNNE